MNLPIIRKDVYYKQDIYVSNYSGYVKNFPDSTVGVSQDLDLDGKSFFYENVFEAYNVFSHTGAIVKYDTLKHESGLAFLEGVGKVRMLKDSALYCSFHVSLSLSYGQTLVYLRKNSKEEPGTRCYCIPPRSSAAVTTFLYCKEGDLLEVALLGPGKVLEMANNILLRTA